MISEGASYNLRLLFCENIAIFSYFSSVKKYIVVVCQEEDCF